MNNDAIPSPLLHPVAVGGDVLLDAVALAAARSFLRARSRGEVVQLLHAAVSTLGGAVVPARERPAEVVLPDGSPDVALDVSLGAGETLLVVPVARSARVRDRLAEALPGLVADAWVAAGSCDRFEQQELRASVDELTGLANRRAIRLHLSRATRGDIVCLIDLDHFKVLNDALGHAAGDEALQRLGDAFRGWFRDDDFAGRYGGDEFLIILKATRLPVAVRRLRELADHWSSQGGELPTLSAGVARVDARGGPAALRSADRALYRAKERGRNTIEGATVADAGGEDAT